MKTNAQHWFKYSGAEELKKTVRSPYSKCLHFDSSGIGETKAEKEKLRSWKKNCGFCKIKRPRSASDSHEDDVPDVEESEREESSGMGEIKEKKGLLLGWMTKFWRPKLPRA